MIRDAVYGLRMLQKNIGFAVVTVLTLALAIGANTVMFNLTNALIFKSQPGIGHPAQLVDLGKTRSERPGDISGTISYPNYLDYAQQTGVFSGLLAYTPDPLAISFRDSGPAERLYGTLVTSNYFDVLEVKPAVGRFFLPGEDQPSSPLVAVISDALWKSRFSGNPGAVGRNIVMNGHLCTIVGIAPPHFQGSNIASVDVWLPLAMHPLVSDGGDLTESRGSNWLGATGRLAPGVSLEKAQAGLSLVSAQLQKAYPESNEGVGIKGLRHAGLPYHLEKPLQLFLMMLMSIVGAILMIACANVVGMSLAQATSRHREMAVRLAIGASRSAVIRQLIIETLVLFGIATAVGAVLSTWMAGLFTGMPSGLAFPIAIDASPDLRVVLFTAGLALISGILSGLIPALHATRMDLNTALKTASSAMTYRRPRLRSALVVGQIATSLLLLITAGLFVRSLAKSRTFDAGFDPDQVQVFSLNLFIAGYKEEDGRVFTNDVLQRARALPGVDSAAMAVDLPMDGNSWSFGGINVDGYTPPGRAKTFAADWNLVSSGFFRTLRIPLVRGRDFDDNDRDGGRETAIINETMAAQFWPSADPIGKRFYVGPKSDNHSLEVVGVVRDSKNQYLSDDAKPLIYAPLTQRYMPRQALVVRTSNAGNSAPAIRALLTELNPNLPIISIDSMSTIEARGFAPQTIVAWIGGTMGLAGMVLAALGIYGITAYSVNARTREISIRIALGARPTTVMQMMLRQGLRMTMFGIVLGGVIALGVMRLISHFLFGVTSADLLTYVVTTGILGGVAILAIFIPVRRISKVDPVVALHHE